MASGNKYTYNGLRPSGDSPIEYGGETYNVGDEIELTAAEHDRLAGYFYLEPVGDAPKSRQEAAEQPAKTAGSTTVVPPASGVQSGE